MYHQKNGKRLLMKSDYYNKSYNIDRYIGKTEYEKSIDLLEKTANQPSKFRMKNRVKVNDDARERYTRFFTRNIFIRKQSSKTQKPLKNVNRF